MAVFVVVPSDAEILTVTVAATAVVFTVNSATILPAGTVTETGTEALALPPASVIVMPPAGAAEPMVTIPVDAFPPFTVDGLKVSDVNTGGSIVRDAVSVTPLRPALIVATSCVATATVFTVNVARVLPAGTFTDAGTVAAALVLERSTTNPPAGAAPDKVTVPKDDMGPTTVVGVNERDTSTGGSMVRIADCEIVPSVPVMVAPV